MWRSTATDSRLWFTSKRAISSKWKDSTPRTNIMSPLSSKFIKLLLNNKYFKKLISFDLDIIYIKYKWVMKLVQWFRVFNVWYLVINWKGRLHCGNKRPELPCSVHDGKPGHSEKIEVRDFERRKNGKGSRNEHVSDLNKRIIVCFSFLIFRGLEQMKGIKPSINVSTFS